MSFSSHKLCHRRSLIENGPLCDGSLRTQRATQRQARITLEKGLTGQWRVSQRSQVPVTMTHQKAGLWEILQGKSALVRLKGMPFADFSVLAHMAVMTHCRARMIMPKMI